MQIEGVRVGKDVLVAIARLIRSNDTLTRFYYLIRIRLG